MRDSIFIDQRPVENIHYLEYEHWMRDVLNFNPDCFQRIVDTLRLYGVERDSIPYKQLCKARFEDDSLVINYETPVAWSKEGTGTYIRSPATRRYPLINISYEAAKAYCRWRTNAVMLMYATSPNEKGRKKFYKKIQYRLPTQEEWEFALTTFQKEAYIPTAKGNSSLVAQPFPVGGEKAIYALSNVSEMVAEKGVAKGWNWKDKNSYNKNDFTTTYQYPSDWLGFRCVCEVRDWPVEVKVKGKKKKEEKEKPEEVEEEEDKN